MSTKTGSQSHEFRCQFWRSCTCATGYKLLVVDRKGVTVYELFRNEPHTVLSHATSKNKFLAPLQKGRDHEISRDEYNCDRQADSAIDQFAPRREGTYGPSLGLSVERYVRKQRNRILQEQMSGVEMPGKTEVQILRVLCEANGSRSNQIAQ